MHDTRQTRPDVAGTVLTLRILWAALLMGQVVFFTAVLMVLMRGSGAPAVGAKVIEMMLMICTVMLIAALVGGYHLRMQIYKAYWQADAVTPRGYFVGNLLLLAMLEGVSMFGLVIVLLGGALLPAIGPSVVAVASQLVNFPTGRAMLRKSDSADHELER